MELATVIRDLNQLRSKCFEDAKKLRSAAAILAEINGMPAVRKITAKPVVTEKPKRTIKLKPEVDAKGNITTEEKNGINLIMRKLTEGDFQFFLNHYPKKNAGHISLMPYNKALREYRDSKDRISREALRAIVYWLTGKEFLTSHGFAVYLGRLGYRTKQMRIYKLVRRGYMFPVNAEISRETSRRFGSWT